MSTHEETLFTSDSSSGRERPVHFVTGLSIADETPPRIKSVEDEPTTSTGVAPPGAFDGYPPRSRLWWERQIENDAARIAALEAENGKLRETIETMRRQAERMARRP